MSKSKMKARAAARSSKPAAQPTQPKRISKPPPAKAAKPGEAPKPAPLVPTGRAPVRTPERAEELKAKITALTTATNQIKGLKRSLNKSFYEIGTILGEIQAKRLYEAKGYGSFEAFVEREIELGKQMSLRIMRISQTFLKEAALSAGLERTSAALAALEGEEAQAPQAAAGAASPMLPARSHIPPHKQ